MKARLYQNLNRGGCSRAEVVRGEIRRWAQCERQAVAMVTDYSTTLRAVRTVTVRYYRTTEILHFASASRNRSLHLRARIWRCCKQSHGALSRVDHPVVPRIRCQHLWSDLQRLRPCHRLDQDADKGQLHHLCALRGPRVAPVSRGRSIACM